MKIGVFSYFPLPYGMAASTRQITYAKGMVHYGAKVELITIYPYNKEHNLVPSIPNLKIIQLVQKREPVFRLIRVFHFVLSFYRSFLFIWRSNKNEKYDAMIISNDRIFILGPITFFCKILKIKTCFIFDEFPLPIRKYLKPRISLFQKFSYNIIFKRIDGLISMTDKLVVFYLNLSNQSIPYITLSTITDTDRFPLCINKEKSDYLCYMGNMELSKDNILLILEAFSEVSTYYPNLILRLFGKPSNDDKEKLLLKISELNLENKITFEFASFDEVPNILMNAKILVSSQPLTLRASGGFPTKLGEYLASGTPTLTTRIGEIDQYVTDKEHVFLVSPEDANRYALNLIEILENYDQALTVSTQGKRLVFEKYSHLSAGKKIINFINKVNGKIKE
ncbi:glycosyltransferase [Algoriphagus yeomjeoni]|uniref:glycosyltransferase n=1 Tax=Algoriphagus yeomjeoni TaxID=291403 RepID=UPI003CE45DD1